MKTCQYSDILQYISTVIPIKRQDSSRVYIYRKDGKKYAYKEYRETSLFSQGHISQMANYLNELFEPINSNDYLDFQVFSAVPLCLVYEQTVFKGFIMECIPDRCYFQRRLRTGETREEEGVLDWFWNGKITDYSDQDKASFVKRLIRAIKILHQHDIILGDAISANNLLIAEFDGKLAPFFIDTDSFRNKKENPTAIYNSPNYYPPEGKTAVSTKETDIYKLCLIILRFFSTDSIHRPSMTIGDSEANNSLNKIGRVFSESFRKSVENGLSSDPKDRPTIQKMENDINNRFGKQQDVTDAFHTDTQDKPTTLTEKSKPGLNEPCPCGSGLKYKNCHGKTAEIAPAKSPSTSLGTSANTNKPQIPQKPTPAVTPPIQSTGSGMGSAHCKNRKLGGSKSQTKVEWRFILPILCPLCVVFLHMFDSLQILSLDWLYTVGELQELLHLLAWIGIAYSITTSSLAAYWSVEADVDRVPKAVFSTLMICAVVIFGVVLFSLGLESVVPSLIVFRKIAWGVFAVLFAAAYFFVAMSKSAGLQTKLTSSVICVLFLVCAVFLGYSYFRGDANQAQTTSAFSNLAVGDVVSFGRYEQDGNLENGPEDIEWRVLEITDDNRALLLSEYCLDCMPYNENGTDNSWSNSIVRAWLNGEFLSEAFSETERASVAKTVLESGVCGLDESISRDEQTEDEVFILDYETYKQNVDGDAKLSAYAKEKYLSAIDSASGHTLETSIDSYYSYEASYGENYCWCWLRNIGLIDGTVLYVWAFNDAGVAAVGIGKADLWNAVRPAVYVDIIDQGLNSSDDSKSIHYYNYDLPQESDGTYYLSFGPSYWAEVFSMELEDQLLDTAKEFFTRLDSDPVMATACLAYIDKEIGTRYTGEFYSSISNDWLLKLNEIAESFIDDGERIFSACQTLGIVILGAE